MSTIYPDDKEIKFRKNQGGMKNILNNTIDCTICHSDILNEIILKKMIMVHINYLFLCCYNCFFKLCEGNEFSCIICKSNKELSNCEKCNLNICKRCIKNHEINKVSDGILKNCVNCVPRMLWKQRAKAANVLKIFSSQLDMPNGLLVNEIERDQTVRKYLIKESKIGYNLTNNNIKDQMCMNFILKSFKLSVSNKLSDFFPKIDSTSSTNECLNEFIEICENILEITCSTLTSCKRIFNLNSYLSPGVSAMMKSLLKSVDEDNSILNNSRLNENLEEIMKNNLVGQSSKNLNNTKRKDFNKKHLNGENSKSTLPLLNNINNKLNIKEFSIVLEKLDESVLLKYNINPMQLKDFAHSKIAPSNEVSSDIENDEMVHPLDLFNDTSSDKEEDTRTLRSRTVITNKKEGKMMKKSSKNNTILDAKSDDEKEINRLIRLDNILSSSKKKNENDSSSEHDDEILNVKKNRKVQKSLTNDDKLELIDDTIQNIDEINSGSDNSENEEELLNTVKNVFSELTFDSIPKINTITDDETDDSSIIEVVKSCLPVCKNNNIDDKKGEENLLDVTKMSSASDTSDDLEDNNYMEISDNDLCKTVSYSKPNSLLKMLSPLTSDSDSDNIGMKITRGRKRKMLLSDNSDSSSSRYFKNSTKKQKRRNLFKKSPVSLSDNENSSDSISDDIVTPKRNRRIRQISSDELSYSSDNNTVKKRGRRNIRKLKKKEELSELTQNALIEEELRLKRIEERQKIYNTIYELPRQAVSCEKVVLDFDPKTQTELVVVHPDLVKFLKPHQVEGVQFMWNSVFESLARIKEHSGSGSILAHCMGLGKTLQVITLIHTLFRYPETGIKTVLIISPLATIENWHNEFDKWLNDISEEKNFFIYNLTDSKSYERRKSVITEWHDNHGVLIISYQLYKTIINKSKQVSSIIIKGLVDPGPDLVICDEGHTIKNQATAVAKTINRIKTLRRILLTGTPLQNNLKEYHCMVDFIRPNLLGSIKEFTNRFINPISNGQYSDSTAHDVRVMKRRSHVLHRMLEGFVQRRDYSVLTPFLPPKHEYVIYLKMSDKQIELYRHYLDNHRQTELFTNYNILQMIWTHPKLLKLYSKRTEIRREKEKIKAIEANFTQDTSSDNASSSETAEVEQIPTLPRSKSPEIDHHWWKPLLSKNDIERVHPYSKFLMTFSILKECEEIGDKVLIFSQSLFTLDLLQDMLNNAEDLSDEGGPYGNSWIEGEDYFRIDGSVSNKVRENCCCKFNDIKNTKLRLLLLSTKAFNLGINLVGANRVIIFDVTWNPSLNVQSIFRIFRFGQNKPCYIYRFISEGTMEQKIYERQISKLSMAFRVVDEHQIDRHFNAKDQEELYEFEPNTTEPKSTLNLPKDRLMAELILKHKDLVMDILEHDSLLQNNEAEELNEFDRNAAWEDYQKEKAGLNQAMENMNNQFIRENIMNSQLNNQLNSSINMAPLNLPEDVILFNTLQNLFPQASLLQINDMMKLVKSQQRRINVEQ